MCGPSFEQKIEFPSLKHVLSQFLLKLPGPAILEKKLKIEKLTWSDLGDLESFQRRWAKNMDMKS